MASPPVPAAVLVTGASSGIGRATALGLDRSGFRVFASVRRTEDAQALQHLASERLVPLLLDVTDELSIKRAIASVDAVVGSAGLQGLVNNAGIGIVGLVEYLSLDDLRHQFEVNVIGQIAMIQACLPLIRRGHGRIINIGSVGDRITIPFGGLLCSSKSAFASLTEALRLELHPWGIHVCLIEPGSITTPAIDKVLRDSERTLRRLPAEGAERYARLFRTFTRRAVAREQTGSSPDVVAAAVLRALTAPTPRTRYPVGKDARILTLLPQLLPDRLLDRLRLRFFGMPTAFSALAQMTRLEPTKSQSSRA